MLKIFASFSDIINSFILKSHPCSKPTKGLLMPTFGTFRDTRYRPIALKYTQQRFPTDFSRFLPMMNDLTRCSFSFRRKKKRLVFLLDEKRFQKRKENRSNFFSQKNEKLVSLLERNEENCHFPFLNDKNLNVSFWKKEKPRHSSLKKKRKIIFLFNIKYPVFLLN